MVQQIGEQFHSVLCRAADPRPELVREARALIVGKDAGAAKIAEAPPSVRPSGEELAKRAIAQAKADGTGKRSSLGAQPASEAVTAASVPFMARGAPLSGADKTGPAKVPAAGTKTSPSAGADKAADKSPGSRLALAGAGTAGAKAKTKTMPDTALPPSANQRCRVWTASYGGQKALIIRSVSDQVVNFTVLDVNDGSEQREAEAFISAYAKNGKIAGEYTSQAQALDKAFELCPEG
jgi:hypothetical protein